MLHVASVCTTCCMLLDDIVCCCAKFETGQIFQLTSPNISFVPWSPKRSATMLDPFAQFFQHCWGHARSFRIVYKDLWAVSFPRCTAGLGVLHPFAHHCQHARNNSQHCCANNVGSCCVRLHAAYNSLSTVQGRNDQARGKWRWKLRYPHFNPKLKRE